MVKRFLGRDTSAVHAETVFILLFVVATTVAIAARRWRIPYTVALVLAGLLLGSLHVLDPPHLTKRLLFAIFLPGLLFEAAYHTSWKQFWSNRTAIFSLAVPGVVAAIALTTVILAPLGEALRFGGGFDWRLALVFGAIIAATDPIAVVALFKSLGAPKRLGTLVEGESLLNDGTSIVFFTLILGFIAGETVSARALAGDFVRVVGLGALIGAAVGMAVSQVIRRLDDPMIEITLTTIAAYGAFVTAEQFHDSGVIATVVAGMICGNYAARTGMSPSTRVAVETFWEYVAFALNSIVFLLIGFEVKVGALLASWLPIVAAFLVVTFGRAIVIAVASGLLGLTRDRLPRSWSVVMAWGGLRGGLSMVLALSLPADFPQRDLLVTITFGVVIMSILGQGLTMAPLLRWLGVVRPRESRARYEQTRGALLVANAGLNEVESMTRARHAPQEVLAALHEEYEARIERAEAGIQALHLEEGALREEEMLRARRHLLVVEKDRVLQAFHQGTLSQDVYEKLLADIDARLLALEDGTPREGGEERDGEPPGAGAAAVAPRGE